MPVALGTFVNPGLRENRSGTKEDYPVRVPISSVLWHTVGEQVIRPEARHTSQMFTYMRRALSDKNMMRSR